MHPIILFHGVTKDETAIEGRGTHTPVSLFERQLKWLKYFFPNAVITFDDGYRNVLYNAIPICEKYGFKPIVFINTGIKAQWQDIIWKESQGNGSWEDIVKFKQTLKERQDDELRLIMKGWGDKIFEEDALLSHEEIKELSKHAIIGSHSHTHPIFTKITAEQAEKELEESKLILERITGKQIEHFAFPDGKYIRSFDKSDEAIALIVYKYIYASEPRPNKSWNALPRISFTGNEKHAWMWKFAIQRWLK